MCECARNVPTQQKVSFTALDICAFTVNSHARQAGLLIIYLFPATWGWKKRKERNRKPKRAAATFLLKLEGLLKPSTEVSSDSLLHPLSVPKSPLAAAAWFHHLAKCLLCFSFFRPKLVLLPPPPPPPLFLLLFFWGGGGGGGGERVEGERRKTLQSISGPDTSDSHKYLQTSHFTSPAQELLTDC